MKVTRTFFSMLLIAIITGCATTPKQSISLKSDYFTDSTKSIGIYLDTIPKTSYSLPGASCLLCLAVAAAANSTVSSYVSALPSDELTPLPKLINGVLNDQGLTNVVNIEQTINIKKLKKFKAPKNEKRYAPKDFRSLKNSVNVDQLAVIDIWFVGAQRSYANYIPRGGPVATVIGEVNIINLADNSLVLFQPLRIEVSVQGDWDEPPTFPGLTNAYYSALAQVKEKILESFKETKAIVDATQK